MKINELITSQGNSISFEFFPPKTSEGEKKLFKRIKELQLLKPDFVSVTQHMGHSTLYKTRHIVACIREETPLTVMPHLACADINRQELVGLIENYRKLGIENILALRGDYPESSQPREDALQHASDLVQLIKSFQAFSIGVAVYPEGHPESPDLNTDMLYTRQKIDTGADFIITQMFFENRYLYNFLDRLAKAGIRTHTIAGIMPLTDIEKINKFSKSCGATVPSPLAHKIEDAASQEEALKLGIDFTTRQCLDLWQNGIRCFHFYTLNHTEAVMEILRNLKPLFSTSPRS